MPDKKKVSCWSLAGCCWGWNRESKFQNELSIKLLVGISVKLKKQKQFMSFWVWLLPENNDKKSVILKYQTDWIFKIC